MALQEAVLDDFGHHALVEAGGVQVGSLLGLGQLAVHGPGCDDEADAQAGSQHLGERAHVDHALGVACSQGQGRLLLVPEVAVGIVLDQGDVPFPGHLHEGLTAGIAHGAAGGILEVGQHIGQTRLVGTAADLPGEVLDQHAFVIAVHADGHGLHGGEGLQRAEVGGLLDQQTAALVQEHLADQVQRLLAAGGDQDLLGIDVPGQEVGNCLAQRGKAFGGRVLQGCGAVALHHGLAGFGERVQGEGLGGGQAASHADDAGAVGQLEDLADGGGVHLGSTFCQRPGCHKTVLDLLRCQPGQGLGGVHSHALVGHAPARARARDATLRRGERCSPAPAGGLIVSLPVCLCGLAGNCDDVVFSRCGRRP